MYPDKKQFARDLEERTLKFAISIIKFSSQLGNSKEQHIIRNQISKSGSSVGANYREANRARSKADFKNKIKICESEASETQYWLDIIRSLNWLAGDIFDEIYKESSELLAIFTSISQKLSK